MKVNTNKRGRKPWLIVINKGEVAEIDLSRTMASWALKQMQHAGYCSMASKLSDRYVFGYFGWDTQTLAEGIGSACHCNYDSWQDISDGIGASIESIKAWFKEADPHCYRFLNILEAEQAKKASGQ